MMQTAAKFGLVALIALGIEVLPGGGSALNVGLTVLTIAFFTVIVVFAMRLFRQYRMEIDSLEPRQRLVLYGSIGLAFLAFVATRRMFDEGGIGVLAWLALLGLCSYGVFWVWTQYRQYD